LTVRYEIPVGDEIRAYEANVELVIHGPTLDGLTQAILAVGLGVLDLSDADRTSDWKNRPRFGGGDGGGNGK